MAKKHDLKVCKGKFDFKGNICNRESDRFAHNVIFDSGAEKNEANIGISTSAENQVYVKIEDFVKEKAKFSKYDNTEKKNYTTEVDWEDRFDFDEEGYQPFFGVRIKTDANGETESLFGYDAVEELKALKDGQGVYTRGKIDFSSYKKQTNEGEELIRKVDFKADGVYAQKESYVFEGEDFDSENFDENNKFEQEIVYLGIEKHPEQKDRFVVSTYVVTYNGVESVEFFIDQKKLADLFKKKLKPYTGINVMGRLYNRLDETKVEEQDEEDSWGDDTDMTTTYVPRIREMVITKAYPSSIDTESYTEANINAVLKADEDFGGDAKDSGDDEDDVWE